mmetsp:Transcript_30785/g.50704  ORF Transcript_30785/g.50704 Transcript_30785/m.50704 type:complete len:105 (+) Transcript_30785:236-550(+)
MTLAVKRQSHNGFAGAWRFETPWPHTLCGQGCTHFKAFVRLSSVGLTPKSASHISAGTVRLDAVVHRQTHDVMTKLGHCEEHNREQSYGGIQDAPCLNSSVSLN